MYEEFDFPPDRRSTNSFKWDFNQQKFGREDVIPLWIADMDFAVPQAITDALEARLAHPVFGYSFRTQEYRSAILDWLKARHGWDVAENNLLFYPPGTVAAINCLVNLFSDIGDEIIVQTPSYPPLMNIVKQNKRVLIEYPLINVDGKYQIDFVDLANRFNAKTKMLLLCSPHNPTGRVWTEQELQQVAELCRNAGVMLVSDEVHADLLYPGNSHYHFNRLPQNERPKSVTIISACKTFNIASLPQSTLICDDPTIRRIIQNAISTSHLNLDGAFSAVATQAGYQSGALWLDRLMAYIEANRNLLKTMLDQLMPQVKLVKAQGTYLAWLDFRSIDIKHEVLFGRFVEEAGVGLYDGLLFGEVGRGYFRINLACPASLLQQALRQMAVVIETI